MGNKSSGWNLHAMFKETWGNRMSVSDWTLAQDGTGFAFRRGIAAQSPNTIVRKHFFNILSGISRYIIEFFENFGI